MHVLFYDENFKYAGEDDIEINIEEGEELPPNCTTSLIPAGLYDPKYDSEKEVWVESATQEYIDGVKSPAPEPSEISVLKEQNAKLLLNAAIAEQENVARREREAQTAILLAQLQDDINALKGGTAS